MMQLPDLPSTALPLRDIRLPGEPGFWPLAPGWWVLLVMALGLLTWLSIKWWQHRGRKQQWQAIEQQLTAIEFAHQREPDKQRLLRQLSGFLRRFVRHHLRDDVAISATGDDWINHLNQWLPGQPFTPFREALTVGMYQPACDYDDQQLLELTRRLIKSQVLRARPGSVAGGRHV